MLRWVCIRTCTRAAARAQIVTQEKHQKVAVRAASHSSTTFSCHGLTSSDQSQHPRSHKQKRMGLSGNEILISERLASFEAPLESEVSRRQTQQPAVAPKKGMFSVIKLLAVDYQVVDGIMRKNYQFDN